MTIEKTPVLEITRIIDAAPERVFDAWLDKSWGDWAGPAGIKGEVTLLEPRVGGRYRMVMHRPDGSSAPVGGVYKEIARPSAAGDELEMGAGRRRHADPPTHLRSPAGKGTEEAAYAP